jgi:arylsulfatase A-like enzyme
MTDQQRADTVAALGNPAIQTPSLDRLAEEGTAFTSCYTPSPVCIPARQALVTGLPPHQTGCFDNGANEMPFPSLMERLQALGYQTHGVGKMHFVPDLWRMWGFEGRDTSEELQPITSDKDDFCHFLRESGYGHVDEPHGLRSEMYYIRSLRSYRHRRTTPRGSLIGRWTSWISETKHDLFPVDQLHQAAPTLRSTNPMEQALSCRRHATAVPPGRL